MLRVITDMTHFPSPLGLGSGQRLDFLLITAAAWVTI
jgi:hypothetical protein